MNQILLVMVIVPSNMRVVLGLSSKRRFLRFHSTVYAGSSEQQRREVRSQMTGATVPATDKPLRADARRNKEKLLAVAVAAFSGTDADVTLESIAKQAGVGIGTLYRHFPTRDALVAAAYRHEVERLCQAVVALRSDQPPDLALRQWMERFVDYVATKRGMAAALQAVVSTSDATLFADTYAQIVAALTSLLAEGIAAGTHPAGRRRGRRAAGDARRLAGHRRAASGRSGRPAAGPADGRFALRRRRAPTV